MDRTINYKLYATSLILFLVSFQATGASLKSTADSLLMVGNNHYMNKDYEKAIDFYTEVLNRKYVSAALFYNLGNSYFKLNNTAEAILNYEKALLLKPGDEDILQNLAIANSRIVDKIDAIPDFFLRRMIISLGKMFTPNAWAKTSLILFVLALLIFLGNTMYRKESLKRLFFLTGIFLMCLSLAGLLLMRGRVNAIEKNDSAIVMYRSINAKNSPDEQSTNVFVLHEGTKVSISDSVHNWREIRIADGNKGWIPSDALKEIRIGE